MKKDFEQLCEQQINEIFSLRQEVEKQREEIKHLKDLLYNATPLISTDSKISDEEFISLNELKKLKQKSEQEPLTYEDAKKVELYFKVVREIRNPKEKAGGKAKELSTEELLAAFDEKETQV